MTDKQRQWCEIISLALWQPGVPLGLRAQALDALNQIRHTFDWMPTESDSVKQAE